MKKRLLISILEKKLKFEHVRNGDGEKKLKEYYFTFRNFFLTFRTYFFNLCEWNFDGT